MYYAGLDFDSYFDEMLPNKGRSCSEHVWVDTGTKRTWCKKCNADGHFDGTLAKFVATDGVNWKDFKEKG